jgi:tetratricopeptide (TPR) repeat protein
MAGGVTTRPINNPYASELDKLESESLNIAQVHGRKAAIQEYRRWIAQHPAVPECLRAEIEIAKIDVWILPDGAGDSQKSLNEYLQGIKQADKSNPYLVWALESAAETAADLDRNESNILFNQLLKVDPSNDAARLEAYMGLGCNDLAAGNQAEAEKYFGTVLAYDSTDKRDSSDFDDTQSLGSDAGRELIHMAAGTDSEEPALRLERLNQLLKKYPELEFSENVLVDQIERDLMSKVDKKEKQRARALRE